MAQSVLTFISLVRNSFLDAAHVYTNGSCYEFHKVLKFVYPDAIPWYHHGQGHVWSEINGVMYDINGTGKVKRSEMERMDTSVDLMRKVHTWSKRGPRIHT